MRFPLACKFSKSWFCGTRKIYLIKHSSFHFIAPAYFYIVSMWYLFRPLFSPISTCIIWIWIWFSSKAKFCQIVIVIVITLFVFHSYLDEKFLFSQIVLFCVSLFSPQWFSILIIRFDELNKICARIRIHFLSINHFTQTN